MLFFAQINDMLYRILDFRADFPNKKNWDQRIYSLLIAYNPIPDREPLKCFTILLVNPPCFPYLYTIFVGYSWLLSMSLSFPYIFITSSTA